MSLIPSCDCRQCACRACRDGGARTADMRHSDGGRRDGRTATHLYITHHRKQVTSLRATCILQNHVRVTVNHVLQAFKCGNLGGMREEKTCAAREAFPLRREKPTTPSPAQGRVLDNTHKHAHACLLASLRVFVQILRASSFASPPPPPLPSRRAAAPQVSAPLPHVQREKEIAHHRETFSVCFSAVCERVSRVRSHFVV